MHFGVYSLLLGVGAVNGVFLAVLLLLSGERSRGAIWLSALCVGLSLRLLPYILGFAGAYDLHPALTFAPFDTTLAWGPLLWGYVHILAQGRAPTQTWRHFVPFIAQVLYQGAAFALPVPQKWAWYSGIHLNVVEPLGSVLVLVSFASYGFLAWREYERWQTWLDENLSNREESRLGWLRVSLIGFGLLAALGAIVTLVHLVRPLDYFARLPLVAALPLLAYVITLLGYRYGPQSVPIEPLAPSSDRPPVVDTVGPEPMPAPSTESVARGTKDYAAEAARWRQLVITNGWHRDSQLTATTLSALLQCSPRSLSRTLNEGLGESFNDFVNRIRVEEAVALLARPNAADVLRVAFDVGFASKASFNRAFRRHTGATPTAIRDGGALRTSQNPPVG